MIGRTVRCLAYLVSGLVGGVAGLAWSLIAGITVGLLSVTQLGPRALLIAGWVTRRFAELERRRASLVLKAPIVSAAGPPPGRTVRERARSMAQQPSTWREWAWLALLFPVGLAAGLAGIVIIAVNLGAATAPLWAWAVPNPNAPWLARLAMTTPACRLVLGLVGLALLPFGARLVRALARAEAAASRALLAGSAHQRLVEQADRLARTRAGVVDAQAAELRRIERDLHDGAQARIVAAGMILALAERRLRADPSGAPAAADLRRARRQLDDALGELRRLVRGIHPPILTDRGLFDAVTALAGDSPLTVRLQGEQSRRLPPAVESAAYFVVAEGLANAAKHASATAVDVAVAHHDGAVVVTVTDDGRGGADPTGTGLDGLRRRVEALDGTLTLTSPPGGPTVLNAELPCASS